ncbi:hypothetical protein DPMN_103740 [Dreissena polymorpha]|uniref:Uncharacterized protein n=1 Tax=Dreissena polymorpha TaxID=45954 RepID=A0A9D4K0G7_DREPO|nr:hypothetical protein DPMN_103740 [Dreissena polymorpha]
MMSHFVRVFIWKSLLTILTQKEINCVTLPEVENLYERIFNGYDKRFFPLLNQSETVIVSVKVSVVSINKFDEISGDIDITVVFNMIWEKKRLTWTPSDFGGKTSILIDPQDIWKPQLLLLESFDSVQDIGQTPLFIRLFSNSSVFWSPAIVLSLSCTVDVTYFPFDIQICTMTIGGWAYRHDEIALAVSNSTIDKSFYIENNQWDLLNDSSLHNLTTTDIAPSFTIQLKLKRRSEFFVVYIIIPLIFLGLINNIVFSMPVASGERMSVAVTIFLSFVVYLEMINNNVPESSNPVAFIYVYVLFLLAYSCVILLACLVSLRIYDKAEPVPEKLKTVIKWLRFRFLWRRNRSVVPTSQENKEDVNEVSELPKEDCNDQNDDTAIEKVTTINDITWNLVGKTYDIYVSIILYTCFAVMTGQTFFNLSTNSSFLRPF